MQVDRGTLLAQLCELDYDKRGMTIYLQCLDLILNQVLHMMISMTTRLDSCLFFACAGFPPIAVDRRPSTTQVWTASLSS